MQGYNLEDVASGIDEMMIRQPLGVTAAITPFNFPAMIPFWFLPYAIACGNTFILKASEKVPLTMQRAFELMEALKLPAGVLNLIHGDKTAVDVLLEHPEVRAISFVGSSPVAKYIYAQAAKFGKRVQCQGGAKNHVLILPDADLETTTRIVSDSAFGCAGQRCLAVSVAVTVGDARNEFTEEIAKVASAIRVGNGLDKDVQMGPVITSESKKRIEGLIAAGGKRRSESPRGWTLRQRFAVHGKFFEADAAGWRAGRQRAFHNRNFWAGAQSGSCKYAGRRNRNAGAQPVWEYGFDFHEQRRRRQKIPLRSAGG